MHKDSWIGVCLAATVLNVVLCWGLNAALDQRNDARAERNDARSNLHTIATRCTVYVDGSLSCPPETVEMKGHLEAAK